MLPELTATLAHLAPIAAAHPGLQLLVLHGSRARGDAHAGSDWDFAYQASTGFDPSLLHADLCLDLKTDRVDLADLAASGGLLRYRVARDGVVVFEGAPKVFDRFWFDAVSFWCDAAPVLRAGYAAVLKDLDS